MDSRFQFRFFTAEGRLLHDWCTRASGWENTNCDFVAESVSAFPTEGQLPPLDEYTYWLVDTGVVQPEALASITADTLANTGVSVPILFYAQEGDPAIPASSAVKPEIAVPNDSDKALGEVFKGILGLKLDAAHVYALQRHVEAELETLSGWIGSLIDADPLEEKVNTHKCRSIWAFGKQVSVSLGLLAERLFNGLEAEAITALELCNSFENAMAVVTWKCELQPKPFAGKLRFDYPEHRVYIQANDGFIDLTFLRLFFHTLDGQNAETKRAALEALEEPFGKWEPHKKGIVSKDEIDSLTLEDADSYRLTLLPIVPFEFETTPPENPVVMAKPTDSHYYVLLECPQVTGGMRIGVGDDTKPFIEFKDYSVTEQNA